MRWFRVCVLALFLGVITAPVQAHFVWVVLDKGPDGKGTAHVYFSEEAAPGEAYLVDRIAHAKVTFRAAAAQPRPVKLKAAKREDEGELVGVVHSSKPCALDVVCKYGVFSRGEKSFLLHYYAKYLQATPQTLKALGRAKSLALDVVPQAKGKGVELTVLWRGKPVKGSQVVIIDPNGKQSKAETADDGRVEIESLQAGLYSIRARLEQDKSGSENGESYQQTLHYCTLALQAPGDSEAAPSLSAAELLFKARDARAVWEDFPGFRADLTVNENGQAQRGKITVSPDGEVTLGGMKLAEDSRVERTLRSTMMHRLSNSGFKKEVSFADEETNHPLGRLIRLDYDSRMASAYRVQGDVIREVNRQMGEGRFTISVLKVYRSAEGKYLPDTFTVSFWNKDGTLRTTSTVHETWVRVGRYDLPKSHISVSTGKDLHNNVTIEMTNHELLKAGGK